MLLPSSKKGSRSLFYRITILLVVLIGLASSAYVYVRVNESGRAHILDRAETIAEVIPVGELESLKADDSDRHSESYQDIKALLERVRSVNRDVRFVYLIGKAQSGDLFFYADSEDPSSPDYSPPGQVYYEATPLMKRFFVDGRSVTEGPDQDRWGLWISGYAPVTDKSGKVIALLGIDLPAYQYLSDVLAYSLLPLLVALMLIVILRANQRARNREFTYVEQKAEFLSIASHEIRAPLTGIRWAIEGILKDKREDLAPQTRTMLSLVHDQTVGLIGRLNNLLDAAMLETKGSLALAKESIDTLPFIQSVADSLSLSARERNVAIAIDPSVQSAGSFVADRQLMHHAIFNLLSNAIKYTREGSTVTISYQRSDKSHVFKVRDEGAGISEKERGKIFEGYTRTVSAIHGGQVGTGLGLFLTRKAAEAHGGSVEVESDPGKGTTFTLSIPVR